MNVSQQSDPQVFDLSGPNSNLTETPSREAAVHFVDVDSPLHSILFVDDEPRILEACRVVFEAFGFSILTARSGEKALDLLQADGADAVVLDTMLPGLDGDRNGKAHDKIPILLSSHCASLLQSLFEIVNASVDNLARSETFLEALEQLQAAMYEE